MPVNKSFKLAMCAAKVMLSFITQISRNPTLNFSILLMSFSRTLRTIKRARGALSMFESPLARQLNVVYSRAIQSFWSSARSWSWVENRTLYNKRERMISCYQSIIRRSEYLSLAVAILLSHFAYFFFPHENKFYLRCSLKREAAKAWGRKNGAYHFHLVLLQ